MADEEKVYMHEQWVYTGIRESRGKRYTSWLDQQDEPHEYAQKESFVIGYLYNVMIRRDSEHVWRHGDPVFAGDRQQGTAEQRREWTALDRVAQTRLATQARERSAKRTDELTEAIEPILEIARKLPMAADRDAFAAYVLRRINNVWH